MARREKMSTDTETNLVGREPERKEKGRLNQLEGEERTGQGETGQPEEEDGEAGGECHLPMTRTPTSRQRRRRSRRE